LLDCPSMVHDLARVLCGGPHFLDTKTGLS
jgi:hypothetical protein